MNFWPLFNEQFDSEEEYLLQKLRTVYEQCSQKEFNGNSFLFQQQTKNGSDLTYIPDLLVIQTEKYK